MRGLVLAGLLFAGVAHADPLPCSPHSLADELAYAKSKDPDVAIIETNDSERKFVNNKFNKELNVDEVVSHVDVMLFSNGMAVVILLRDDQCVIGSRALPSTLLPLILGDTPT